VDGLDRNTHTCRETVKKSSPCGFQFHTGDLLPANWHSQSALGNAGKRVLEEFGAAAVANVEPNGSACGVEEETKRSEKRSLLGYEVLMTGKRAQASDDLPSAIDHRCADRVTDKTIGSPMRFIQVVRGNDCSPLSVETIELKRPRVGLNVLQAYRFEQSTIRFQHGDSSYHWIPGCDGVSMQHMERSDTPELARSIARASNLTKQTAH
jgi:hypothetical protein